MTWEQGFIAVYTIYLVLALLLLARAGRDERGPRERTRYSSSSPAGK